jgi:hypothetical protein
VKNVGMKEYVITPRGEQYQQYEFNKEIKESVLLGNYHF